MKARFVRAVLPLTVLALTQGGCGILRPTNGAIGRFVADHSCPGDRVRLRETYVLPQDLSVTATPPAEVAADPARLAVWKDNARPHFEDGRLMAVEVTGCGAHRTYFCWWERTTADTAEMRSSEVDLESPHATFQGFRISPAVRQRLEASREKPPGFWERPNSARSKRR